MLTQVSKIDESGFYLEPVIKKVGDLLVDNEIAELVPEGFYHPKWNGSEWVEGKTQTEIDAILATPKQLTENEILGQQLVDLDLKNLELESENQILGSQIVDLELRLLAGGL